MIKLIQRYKTQKKVWESQTFFCFITIQNDYRKDIFERRSHYDNQTK